VSKVLSHFPPPGNPELLGIFSVHIPRNPGQKEQPCALTCPERQDQPGQKGIFRQSSVGTQIRSSRHFSSLALLPRREAIWLREGRLWSASSCANEKDRTVPGDASRSRCLTIAHRRPASCADTMTGLHRQLVDLLYKPSLMARLFRRTQRLSRNRGRAPFCRSSQHLHLPLQRRRRPAERRTHETRQHSYVILCRTPGIFWHDR
jgi:hypothetical protein